MALGDAFSLHRSESDGFKHLNSSQQYFVGFHSKSEHFDSFAIDDKHVIPPHCSPAVFCTHTVTLLKTLP